MATSPGSSLSLIRVVIGVSVWLMPNLTGRLFGLDPKGNPQSAYLGRLFGIRDLALAGFATQSTGPSRKLAWQLGIACDVFDAAAAALAGRNGTLPKHAAVMVGTTAVVAAGLGVAALQAEE